MRKLFFLACFCYTALTFAQKPFLETQKSISIDREELAKYGYLPAQGIESTIDKQPFSTKEEMESFIFKVVNEYRGDLPGPIVSWVSQNLSSYNDGAIVFIRHPLDLSKLFNNDYKKLIDKYSPLCESYNKAINQSKLFEKEYGQLTESYKLNLAKADSIRDAIKDIETKPVTKKIKADIAAKQKALKSIDNDNTAITAKMGQLRSLIDSHRGESELYFKEMKDIQAQYNLSKKFIVEDTAQLVSTILSKENFEWSDYLLNKRNVMLVMVGGISSFSKYEIQITNRKKKYQEELSDLALLVKQYGVTMPESFEGSEDSDCSPTEPEAEKIPITFALIKRSKVDPPSSIEFVKDKKVVTTLADVHEKSFVGIKVGVSLLNIDKKQFKLETNNKLTIEPDSLDADEIKMNLMALLELYPFGRDYDRLKPFWEGSNIPFYERLGLVGGVKISKDPLETIFLGGSFAASKTFNITSGIAFHRVAKDIKSLDVGENASLDYLRENADKEYTPKFWVGISLSPGQLFKTLGITRKE